MELLYLLMFLTGWFVCWIQMSKSESQKVQQLQSKYHSLQSEYQQLELKFQGLSQRYVNLNSELSHYRWKLGQLEYQKSLVVGELWRLKNPVAPAEFESQQWKSPYPESAPLAGPVVPDLDSNATQNQ